MFQDSKTMCLFLMEGQITFITGDLLLISDPFVTKVCLREDSDSEEKDAKHASLRQPIPCRYRYHYSIRAERT